MHEKDLEKQLHEQYAINNNANLASIITLLTTLLAVIGVYGYVFIYSTLDFATDWGSFIENKQFTLDVLLFATMAVYFILTVIFYLSAYLGTNQRKEQFVTYAIRRKHYEESDNSDYENIFPREYNPFGKSKTKFIQGLYGEICRIIKVLFWIINALSIIKTLLHFFINFTSKDISLSTLFIIIIFTASLIGSVCCFRCIVNDFYNSYKLRECEFLNKESGKHHQNQTKIPLG